MRRLLAACLLTTLLAPAAHAAVPGALTRLGSLSFHEDDATRALAEARRRGLPVFVEIWAPW